MSGRLLGLIPAPLRLIVVTFSTALSNIIGYTDVILMQPVENMFCVIQNVCFVSYRLYVLCHTECMFCVIQNVSCRLTYLTEIRSWPQWLSILRCGSTATHFLGLRVQILLGAQVSVHYECCVLSGRGLCDGPITCPEESYQVWCVWVLLWNLEIKRSWPTRSCRARGKKLFTTQPQGYIFSDQITNEGMTEMSLITDFTQHTLQKQAKGQNSWLWIWEI
jgi:hypothetical protein